MKKLLVMFFLSFLVLGINAQETSENKEKSKKEKKDKSSKQAKDDAEVFVGEPEGDDYQLEDRKEISKPSMPLYSTEQEFNQMNKKKEQQDAYLNSEYYFPAKPKNAWQVGLKFGTAAVNGDIQSGLFKGTKPMIPGYTVGAYVKKSFNYMFALRMNYHYMTMWNNDAELSTLTTQMAKKLPIFEAEYGIGKVMAHNSKTIAHDLTMDAVVSFGNVKYHKERTRVLFNVFASAGGMMFQTWYDQLDESGSGYDYNSVDFDQKKKEINKDLEALRDGEYETRGERSVVEGEGFLGSNYQFLPVFGGGAGLTFRVNRIIDLDLEGRVMATRNDDIDGLRWEETNTLTAGYDTYSSITLGVNFKLVGKKKTEPTTLLNPMHFAYQKMAENDPENVIEELLKDDDEDGVPNRLDQELDTPKGAPVSTKGIALDSDADGIIDLNDEEPFSPPGVPVNDKGVAQLPPVDAFDANAIFSCDNPVLPSIHFAKDMYNIQPEFYAHLHNLADKMTWCKDLKIAVVGMTDKDDTTVYNDQLSWNRANEIITYMVDKYKIDRSRFVLKYVGEAEAKASTLIEQYKERRVVLEPAKAGDTNADQPAPKIKAGSNK